MNLELISSEEAKAKIQKECGERLSGWMDDAKWFLCSLDADEFQNLLVYYNGPQIGWQLLTPNSSSRISDVARALYDYAGPDLGLVTSRKKVSELEEKIDSVDCYRMFCLCRVGNSGPITLFETNHRALALYWHCFLLHKGEFPTISGVLGVVSSKQPFQFE
jgi:hypothetical protein